MKKIQKVQTKANLNKYLKTGWNLLISNRYPVVAEYYIQFGIPGMGGAIKLVNYEIIQDIKTALFKENKDIVYSPVYGTSLVEILF